MKSIKLKLSFLLLAILTVLPASAKSSFDLMRVRDVVQGSQFRIELSFSTDGELNSLPQAPKAPELKGCQFLYGPSQTTSSSYQMSGGVSTSNTSVTYTFTYKAEKEGTVTVPAITITVNGKSYSSKPQSFNIVKNNNPQPSTPQSSPQQSQGEHNAGSKITPQDLMVRMSFSKSHVYEQEPVIATIKLYVRYDNSFTIDGSSFKTIKLPVFDGFLSEDLPVSQGEQLERFNDKVYYTFELKKALLFPQKAGQLNVHSGEYTITALEREMISHGFFASYRTIPREMSTSTNTASLRVEALPQPKPANFCGAVGKFTLKSELQPDMISTNEAGTYSLIFEGTGNIKYLTIPEIEFPSTFDKYTAKTEIDAKFNGATYAGSYRINYPFVPQEMGNFSIPAKQFVYFDLSKKEYVTLETPKYDINVLRGSGTSSSGSQKQVDAVMKDILHIHNLPSEIEASSDPIVRSSWYWMTYFAALFALVMSTIIYRQHIKRSADVAGRKLARANRVATKRFKIAAGHMKAHRSEQFYEELARALKGYIGDKLSMAPSQLIGDIIVEKLTAYGASHEEATNVLEVLNECEMARFTPSQSDAAMSDIYGRAFAAIKSIEGIKNK